MHELLVAAAWAADVRDVGVVSRLATEESCAGWAAEGHGAIVVVEVDALGDDGFLKVGHVVWGVEAQVLVVGDDEDYVRLFGVCREELEDEEACCEDAGKTHVEGCMILSLS